MRIEPLSNMPPKMERPVATGAADPAAVDQQLLSNNPELPVTAVQETQKTTPPDSRNRGKTVWLEREQRTVFRVLDQHSGEVITQIPSEQVIKVSENISELLQDSAPNQLDVES